MKPVRGSATSGGAWSPVWLAVVAASLGTLSGCRSSSDGAGADDLTDAPALVQAEAQAPLPLELGVVPGRPWARRACTDAAEPDVLACVGGVAITEAMYEHTRAAAPADEAPRATLQRLIDAELLAAAAADAGLWRGWLRDELAATLAQRTLVRAIEEGVTEERVTAADVEFAFKNAAIRSRYKRVEAFYVTDAQFLCCKGDWRQCLKREEAQACIDEHASLARGLYDALQADPPASAEQMEARVKQLALEQFPGFSVASLTFYYDRSKPYSEQKGYDLMVQPFAEAVVKMQPETVSEPIRTPYGWHIPRLNTLLPARDFEASDPEVRADVARNILPMIRQREVMRFAGNLVRKLGARLYPDRLETAAR